MLSRVAAIAIIGVGLAIMLGYGPNFGATENDIPSIDSMEAVGDVGPLDGMAFVGMLGPDGKPKDVEDKFVFANGTFVSKECELRCDYPARAYFINETGNATEFVSKSRCPYKDAEITWHGTVEGDRISGIATWTMKRWYWTVTNTFAFEGSLSGEADRIASGT